MASQNPVDPPKRVGRLRAAWLVLTGQRVVPQQVMATWLEYQQMFDTLLERWSAQLARQAKAEKKRIERLGLEPDELERAPPPLANGSMDERQAMKAQLRSQMIQGGAQNRVRAALASRGAAVPDQVTLPLETTGDDP